MCTLQGRKAAAALGGEENRGGARFKAKRRGCPPHSGRGREKGWNRPVGMERRGVGGLKAIEQVGGKETKREEGEGSRQN